MKFLDVRTDFAFKKVFGSTDSKARLVSSLNSIIEFKSGDIVDLEIVDPYNIPQLKGMKDTFVDVKALLSDQTTVIIEMQVLNHPGFENRVLYNAAKNYSMQLVKGLRYDLLKPVVAVTIVNFDMFTDNDEVINGFKLLNKQDFSDYCDDIELVFIELGKFNKSLEECSGIQDEWIYFLKNAGDLSVIPNNASKVVKSAYEVSNEAGMSAEEISILYSRQQYIALQLSTYEHAKRLGVEKGIEDGIAQEKQRAYQEKIKMAKEMLSQGIDMALVLKITQLSNEDLG